ncbi:major facilitator superfamily [Rhizoctonia solani AG-1 IA]|uniref:Major facilitator superfamily n=1 Tax=Thanatephorus cucumeris (strain AG1-IA) TaxID=983506 RepID=L8WST3_THACA|nr:major facilitator superfamily [Rhizoctonia solani AG-1 IA]
MAARQQTPRELNLNQSPHGESHLGDSSPKSETLECNERSEVRNTNRTEGAEPLGVEKPFSIYTKQEKWYMVAMAALAGLFSPLASSVYFPAIPTMADAFGKSIELINLTVTMYMVFQGISTLARPMLWGGLADRFGRRPLYLTCLSLLLLSCVGLALVPTDAYWLLMVLRCFQAAGSASMIALGAGVISDIATPAERGGFLGLFTLGPMEACYLEDSGGALFDLLITPVSTFPETLRAIVGDGSRPPQKWNQTPVLILGRKVSKIAEGTYVTSTVPRKSANPLHIFRVFTQPDILLVLICTGIIYSTVGLCFIAYGVGGAVGSVVMGRLLDYDWKKMEERVTSGAASASNQSKHTENKAEKGVHTCTTKPDKQDLPIEHTRLKRVPILFITVTGASMGYGWSIQQKAHLAVPLVLQFVVGFSSMSIMTINQTILVDMYPAQGSSITASVSEQPLVVRNQRNNGAAQNNFVRCLLGAGTISIQDFVINKINPGWTYVLFCGICLLTVPLFVIEWRYGEVWRRRRLLMIFITVVEMVQYRTPAYYLQGVYIKW